MKMIIQLNMISKSMLLVFILFITLASISCNRKIAFANSAVVPAAEGYMKVKKDKNNNYKIELNVIRLADPSRLTPPKKTYVVWMETEQNGTKNIGKLNTSSGMFSSALKSSMNTVTAFNPKGFFITAEDNETSNYPEGPVILKTNDF